MKISKEKTQRISEQIIYFLYINNPKSFFTVQIARELARDEEFIKKILLQLKNKKIILEIKKNAYGDIYVRRSRWKLSPEVYSLYKNKK
jgi:hypothetical protein